MKKLLCILPVFILTSCEYGVHHVYSPDRSQCITIIEDFENRYIIDGEYDKVPDRNYVKTDIRNVIPSDDEFAGCWKNDKYRWVVTLDGATIVENKLDTTQCKFSNHLPLDEYNIPTLKDFTREDCYHFDFELFSVVPKNGAIVE